MKHPELLGVCRRIRAIQQLLHKVETSDIYIHEAHEARAATILSQLAGKPDTPEELIDVAAQTVSVLAGETARADRDTLVELGDGKICVRVVEGNLANGIGLRLWAGCFTVLEEMMAYPSVVEGRCVLELGSGTGVVGVAAHQLGATHVVLTDHEARVLVNLRANVHANKDKSADRHPTNQDDPTYALRVPGMDVYHLDWADWADTNPKTPSTSESTTTTTPTSRYTRGVTRTEMLALPLVMGPHPPSLPPTFRFDTIVASDVLYDAMAAEIFPRTVAARLAPGGRCLVGGPIRFPEVHASFLRNLTAVGLRFAQHDAETSVADEYRGVRLRKGDYEAYVLVYVEHQDAPCDSWWRPRESIFGEEGDV